MTPQIACSSAGTHVGAVRTHNEDAFVDRPDIGLWAVADGAGGHQAGEVASCMIAEALQAIPPGLSAEQMLAQVRLRLAATHQALRVEAIHRGEGAVVASTVVVLLIRNGHYACLWAGDSRAYLWRDNTLTAISRDHSVVQELVDAGTMTAEAAAGHPASNVITRAVGAATDALDLDKALGVVRGGDRFLLCSDGLCKTLDDATLGRLMATSEPEELADRMIAAALAQGVNDNVTAVAIWVTSGGAA